MQLSSLIHKLSFYSVFVLIALLGTGYNDPHNLLFYAPLKVDYKAGTYSGIGTNKTCRVNGAATYTSLGADAVCRDATYGTRLDGPTKNYLLRSYELDHAAWTKTAAVTANYEAGPSGNVDAERIVFGGANQHVYQDVAASDQLGPFDDIVYSFQAKSNTVPCTVDLGSITAIGGIYYGGLVNLTTTWNRYFTTGTAQITGNVRWSISNYSTLGHGTPTCTDISAVDTQLSPDRKGPGQYSRTVAAAVSNSAETITWSWHRRIRADEGTVQLTFQATEKSSWDELDANWFTVPVTAGSWTIGFDASSSSLLFTAGGQTVSTPATWAPWTSHTITVSWAGGRPINVRWDDNYPAASAGNYAVPTFTLGGVITLGGIDGFYRDLFVWNTPRIPTTIAVASYLPLKTGLVPVVGAGNATYTGGASTCLDSGGQSMSDKALNVPCYFDAAGSARGVRVGPAVTNLVRGDMDGVDGATPTDWSGAAGCPKANTGILFHNQVARMTEDANLQQYLYKNSVASTATYWHSVYARLTNFVSVGYGFAFWETTYRWRPLGSALAWSRFGGKSSPVVAVVQQGAGTTPLSGQEPGVGTVLDYDAASWTATSFAPPFCSGAPPVTCTAESLSRAFGAELSATQGQLDLDVTTMFGSNASGIDFGNARGSNSEVFYNGANFRLYWNNTDRTWVFRAGGATVTSLPQTFRPDSTHHLRIKWLDMGHITIQVDGQTEVVSLGLKGSQALAATSYLGTNSAGGAELAGWIANVTTRTTNNLVASVAPAGYTMYADLQGSRVDQVTGIPGTFTRATGSTCQTSETGTLGTLWSGDECYDANGLRLAGAVTNQAGFSSAIDSWTKAAGTTVTANSVIGPYGNVTTAERVVMVGASQYIYTTRTTNPFDAYLYSIFVKAAAPCTLDLSNRDSIGGIYYGGIVNVDTTWTRVWTDGIATLAGKSDIQLSNYSTYGHGGAPTCTTFDVIGGQMEVGADGPGQYCSTGITTGAATCNAETIKWPHTGRIAAAEGQMCFGFRAANRASWDQYADGTFMYIPSNTTWSITFDKSASNATFNGGGTTATAPVTWAPWTDHTMCVAWENGQPSAITWDNDYPGYSAANYATPTFTVDEYIYFGGSVDGLYKNVWVKPDYAVTVPTLTHLAYLTTDLSPSIGAGDYTYTGAASTCLDAGGQSMSDKALNVPCYYDAAGSARGVRVSPATTNLVRGDMDGIVGATPTGWSNAGSTNYPLVSATAFHGNTSTYIEDGNVQQLISVGAIAPIGTNSYSVNIKSTGVTAGYHEWTHTGAAHIGLSRLTTTNWVPSSRITTYTGAGAVYLGSINGVYTAPATGTFFFDAAQLSAATSYAPPFCAGGAPPVTCTAESLSRAFGAELSATSYQIRLYVTTMYGAGTDKGNSGINFGNARGTNAYLISNTGFNVQWNNANRTWVFTDGTQTATSVAQTFAPDSTHEIIIYGVDGFPLMLQVDGQAWVASAGNKAAQALGATTHVLTDVVGGAELAGWVRRIEVR